MAWLDIPSPQTQIGAPRRLSRDELRAILERCPEHLFSTDADELKPLV